MDAHAWRTSLPGGGRARARVVKPFAARRHAANELEHLHACAPEVPACSRTCLCMWVCLCVCVARGVWFVCAAPTMARVPVPQMYEVTRDHFYDKFAQGELDFLKDVKVDLGRARRNSVKGKVRDHARAHAHARMQCTHAMHAHRPLPARVITRARVRTHMRIQRTCCQTHTCAMHARRQARRHAGTQARAQTQCTQTANIPHTHARTHDVMHALNTRRVPVCTAPCTHALIMSNVRAIMACGLCPFDACRLGAHQKGGRSTHRSFAPS